MEGFEVLPTILSIVVVLAVLAATLFLLRWATSGRAGGRRGRSDALIEVIERQPIGRNAALVVVQYNGAQQLLGVTESAITQLSDAVIDLRTNSESQASPQRARSLSAIESLRAKTVRR